MASESRAFPGGGRGPGRGATLMILAGALAVPALVPIACTLDQGGTGLDASGATTGATSTSATSTTTSGGGATTTATTTSTTTTTTTTTSGMGGEGGLGGAGGFGGFGGQGGISNGGAGGATTTTTTTTTTGTGGAGGAGGSPACTVGMVDAGGYCIDATEVTRGAYLAFMNTSPSVANQPAECAFNVTFTPTSGNPPNDTRPVTSIDWCDARAFCVAAGKRLCGGIGGGQSPYASFADATKSEWFGVCSNGGTTAYPYGDAYDGAACNTPGAGSQTVPVGSKVMCVGATSPADAVHDMSGNVWEWEDSCSGTTGGSDTCRLRGGAHDSPQADALCGKGYALPRQGAYTTVGVRCCDDTLP